MPGALLQHTYDSLPLGVHQLTGLLQIKRSSCFVLCSGDSDSLPLSHLN